MLEIGACRRPACALCLSNDRFGPMRSSSSNSLIMPGSLCLGLLSLLRR
jgi:hypothetical protein